MKIKDISKFRTYWKEKEGFNGFDEHFIGTTHNGVNGFYRIVNGTVHDIKADLTPKLQNAQDEQAIYEFLQNAADSNSSNCAVIYDEDYFMVINNGKPFTVEDVEAILNSFQGTKADKSQNKNCDKIGRYGIGFKLVHRLVGKSDGANELIENLDGPVIFSWFEKEHFNDLVNSGENQQFYWDPELSARNSPWLFKISLTCFPTMPNEQVKGLNYDETIIYNKEELYSLKNFLTKHRTRIDKLSLDQGSLFFLKFGHNKHKKLEESLKNISSGIGYSLNTLKTLETVILQEEIVTRIPIERINIQILPSDDAFKTIDPEFPQCPIDVMFGYKCDDFETLKTAPNIYQFFPMRNESHGLSFLIHASSFAKVTDRTKLDDQGESNIHTFQFLSCKIQDLLQKDYQVNIKGKAREIFKAIIFSEISQRQNSQLIVNEFLVPLISYFKANVPSRNDEFLPNQSVLIKKTKLNVNPSDFGIDKHWFYWDIEEDKDLIKEAEKNEKLSLEKWDIARLLEHAEINAVNKWISIISKEELQLLIIELNRRIPEKNLFDIEFLKCSDGDFYSINQLSVSKSALCLFDSIFQITDILNSLDIVTTEINISVYENIFNKASEKIDYLKATNQNAAFDDFIKPATIYKDITNADKQRLFLAVKDLHNVDAVTLKSWKIFRNNEGIVQSLGELVNSEITLEPWLTKYQINKNEQFKELEDYLVQLDQIFPIIIFPKWEEIIDSNEFNETAIAHFYSSILKYYDGGLHKDKSLTTLRYIFCENKFLETGDVFFDKVFESFNDYEHLASAIQKITEYKTPDKNILSFLSKEPFKTNDDRLLGLLSACDLENEEAYELLRYCKETDTKIFSKVSFYDSGSQIGINCDSSKRQYYTTDSDLIDFINEHMTESFVLLPSYLEDFKTFEGVLRNQELYEAIISDSEDIYDLADAFLPLLQHKEIVKSYISSLSDIRLNPTNNLSKFSFEYIVVSKIIQFFEEDSFNSLKTKFVIENQDTNFRLEEIHSSNDIKFDIGNKRFLLKVSDILPNSDNFSKSKTLETLISKLKALELPKSELDKMFSIEIEDDDLSEKIANNLVESIDDNILINSAQVAFALLYEIKNRWTSFNIFEIYALDEKTYKLNDIWYANQYSFLRDVACISKRYEGLNKILKLRNEDPIFKISNECMILFKPTFEEETFICDFFEENIDDDCCKDLVEFLFSEYNIRGKDSRRDFDNTDWSKFGETETSKIIGFNPQNTIVTAETDFIVSEEKAPDWLTEWADTDSQEHFLKALGIHIGDSEIVKLRKSLYDEVEITFDEVSDSKGLNAHLLQNTIKWLADSELWEDKWIHDPRKVELLNSIVDKLEWDENDYWYINTEKLNNDSWEWEDNSYDRWREESDNTFEIRLYKGEVPYNFYYEDSIIAVKQEGDYWFDEESKIFYGNSNKSIQLLLQNAADKSILDSDSIKLLTDQGLERIKELEEENRRLRNQVAKIESRRHQGSEEEIPMSDDLLDNTEEKTRISINEEAQQNIFSVLKSKGYKISDGIEINYTVVSGIINPQGKRIKVVTKSAKGGTIYFNPTEWLALTEDDSQLFVVISGNRVYNVTIDDLEANNDKFHLRFNTHDFALNANLSAFAQLVKFLPGTHFLFKAPISTLDFFKEFGLNERNPSASELSYDDKNLLH